jgi:hypothetical protein
LVDRFLSERGANIHQHTPPIQAPAQPVPQPVQQPIIVQLQTPPPPAPPVSEPAPQPQAPKAATNNHKSVFDFVCEDDVKRALQKGEKIHINAKTIITPSARDLGEAKDVFSRS